MHRERKILLALAIAWVTASSSGKARAQAADCGRIYAAVEQLVWSPGGPNEVGVRDLLEKALATREYQKTICVENQLSLLISAGVVDGRAFLPYVSAMEQVHSAGSRAGSGLRRATDLSGLKPSERERVYIDALSGLGPEGSVKIDLGSGRHTDLTWEDAAARILLEGDQRGFDLVSKGLESRGDESKRPNAEKRIRNVDLPVARARLSTDRVGELLKLIRSAMVGGEELGLAELERSSLVRQALFCLLRERRTRVLDEQSVATELKGIWREVQAREHAMAQEGSGLGLYRSAGPLPYHEFYATQYLIGAIRSFSGAEFEKEWWKKCFPQGPGEIADTLDTSALR